MALKKAIEQVEVLTWGSQKDAGSGFLKQLKLELFGGNPGHAALRITVEQNPQNKALIDKYCDFIPYMIKQLPGGERVYEIYLSAWPSFNYLGEQVASFSERDQSLNSDTIAERVGKAFDWDPLWIEKLSLKVEKRNFKGQLGSTVITSGPGVISHRRNFSQEKWEELINFQNAVIYTREQEGFNLLIEKMQNIIKNENKSYQLTKTIELLLDHYVPSWRPEISSKTKRSKEDLLNLMSLIDIKHKEFMITHQSSQAYIVEKLVQKIENIMSMVKSDQEKYGRITPKTQNEIESIKSFLEADNIELSDAAHFDELQIEALIDNLESKKEEIKEKGVDSVIDLFRLIPSTEYEEYTLMGEPPDNIVVLPMQDGAAGKKGLNLESMLKEASHIASGNMPFSIDYSPSNLLNTVKSTNCSRVTNSILKAGAQESTEAKIFNKKALGFISMPQVVYRNALRFQHTISQPDAKMRRNKVGEKNKEKEIVAPITTVEIKNKDPKLALDEFEKKLNENQAIPIFEKKTQKVILHAMANNVVMKQRYYALCDRAVVLVNNRLNSDNDAKLSSQISQNSLDNDRETIQPLEMMADELIYLKDNLHLLQKMLEQHRNDFAKFKQEHDAKRKAKDADNEDLELEYEVREKFFNKKIRTIKKDIKFYQELIKEKQEVLNSTTQEKKPTKTKVTQNTSRADPVSSYFSLNKSRKVDEDQQAPVDEKLSTTLSSKKT